MEDVEAIQKSLIDVVNQENIEPAYFTPINSDFVTK